MVSRGLEASPAYIAGCVCAAAAGAFLATQSGINSTLGSISGRSFASVVSFAVGLAALVIFWLVDVYGLGSKGPDRQSVAAAPWWAWTGGLLGAFYVAVVIIFVRTLGAATLMAIFVTSQLSTAVTLDALGWVGFKRRPLHWARIAGLVLMVCGVALVTYFDGSSGVRGAAPASGSGGSNSGGSNSGLPAEVGAKESDTAPLLRGASSGGAGSGGGLQAQQEAAAGGQQAAESEATRRLLDGGGGGERAGGEGGGGALNAGEEAQGRGGGEGDVEMALRVSAAGGGGAAW